MNTAQIQFRYTHKLYCMERALDRCDYDAANVFAAQAAYFKRLLTGEPMTTENRNLHR